MTDFFGLTFLTKEKNFRMMRLDADIHGSPYPFANVTVANATD